MTTVTYRGAHSGPSGAAVVEVLHDGEPVGLLRHVVRHSPTGFSWGYGGSGPADLARSLLLDALGDAARCTACAGSGRLDWDAARDDYVPAARDADGEHVTRCWDCDGGGIAGDLPYQQFKDEFVARFDSTWTLSRDDIVSWYLLHKQVV